MTTDYEYLARSIASLSGVPVRVYNGKRELCRFFPADLPKDPMEIWHDEIFSVSEHVGYYVSPFFHCYGILNSGKIKIIIGPTAQIMAD